MANAPLVEVVVEIPRGSFLKRHSSGRLDYVSPVPCPFNYGSIESLIGPDNDLLDAVVLGRRLPRGTRITVRAVGSIRMVDRGRLDDKLICSTRPPGALKRMLILLFFKFYAKCKGIINVWRGHSGHNRCLGWQGAEEAIAQAKIRTQGGTNLRRP